MRIKLCEKSTPVQSVWADFEIRKHHLNSNKFIGYCRDVARNVSTHKHPFQRMLSLAFFQYEFAKKHFSTRKSAQKRVCTQKDALVCDTLRYDAIRCAIRQNPLKILARGLLGAYDEFMRNQ